MAPFNREIASAALSAVPMVTNPNPRGRPLSRSIAICTSVTSPSSEKAARTDSTVASKERLPTKSRLLIKLVSLPRLETVRQVAPNLSPDEPLRSECGSRKNVFRGHVALPVFHDAPRSHGLVGGRVALRKRFVDGPQGSALPQARNISRELRYLSCGGTSGTQGRIRAVRPWREIWGIQRISKKVRKGCAAKPTGTTPSVLADQISISHGDRDSTEALAKPSARCLSGRKRRWTLRRSSRCDHEKAAQP